MIDRFRMKAIKAMVRCAWWLARPTIRGRKVLQHWEIHFQAEIHRTAKNDPLLHGVRSGSLFIGGELVLSQNVDEGIVQMVEDFMNEIEQGDRT